MFWVVDNGSSHRGRAAADRLTQAFPNAHGAPPGPRVLAEPDRDLLLHRPAQGLTPNDFTDLDAVNDRLLAFEARYNETAAPFDWRFTRTDLDQLLDRIAAHEAAAPIQSTGLAAA